MYVTIHYQNRTRQYAARVYEHGVWAGGNWPEDVWYSFEAPSRKLLSEHWLDSSTLDAYEAAMEDCRLAQVVPIIYSEYAAARTFEQQEELRRYNPRFAGAVGVKGGHQSGRALDLHWAKLNGVYSGTTDPQARIIGSKILERHGLIRPYKHEPWHYELRR